MPRHHPELFHFQTRHEPARWNGAAHSGENGQADAFRENVFVEIANGLEPERRHSGHRL